MFVFADDKTHCRVRCSIVEGCRLHGWPVLMTRRGHVVVKKSVIVMIIYLYIYIYISWFSRGATVVYEAWLNISPSL